MGPTSIFKALPDWEKCLSLVLVYPDRLRTNLIPFYDDFINFLPENIKLSIIIKDSRAEKNLLNSHGNKNITPIIIDTIADIWIRDWAPLCLTYEGQNVSTKFIYDPAYFKKNQKKFAEMDQLSGIKLADLIGNQIVQYPDIKLDLGNLTHNGDGTAIISNRIISDNESLSIKYITDLLNLTCGFKKVVFVPVEPGDETGHVDGMVRFLNKNTLVVGKYSGYVDSDSFMNNLVKYLQSELGKEYKIIRLLNAEPEDVKKEGIYSAVGNHVNFLRLEDTIYFPYYGDSISEISLKDFISELSSLDLGIKVQPVNVPEIIDLARFGGVLNCMTWQSLSE